ncbi:MAG: PIN domain-containing protein [Acidobacteriota bacterium]
MIFVDTGPLVARYLKNDQLHGVAVAIWHELERGRESFALSSLVLAETLNLLSQRADPGFAARKGRKLIGSNSFRLFRPNLEEEANALWMMEKFSDQEVGFTDCVSFALMKTHRIRRVFTFDRHFDIPGFERFPLS